VGGNGGGRVGSDIGSSCLETGAAGSKSLFSAVPDSGGGIDAAPEGTPAVAVVGSPAPTAAVGGSCCCCGGGGGGGGGGGRRGCDLMASAVGISHPSPNSSSSISRSRSAIARQLGQRNVG